MSVALAPRARIWGERSVAWGIEEGDHAAVGFHVVGTDVLGNATGFTSGHLGATDVVEQRGLTVVNVAHHGNYRRTGVSFAFELQRFGQGLFEGGIADQGNFVAHFFGDQLRGFLVQDLVDGHRGAHLEHELDHLGGLDRHLVGQLGTVMVSPIAHVTDNRSCRALEAVLITLLRLHLAATATTEVIDSLRRWCAVRRVESEPCPSVQDDAGHACDHDARRRRYAPACLSRHDAILLSYARQLQPQIPARQQEPRQPLPQPEQRPPGRQHPAACALRPRPVCGPLPRPSGGLPLRRHAPSSSRCFSASISSGLRLT